MYIYIYIIVFIRLYKKQVGLYDRFNLRNVIFHIIISRSKVYYNDLQKIKLENFNKYYNVLMSKVVCAAI